jgi:hypothetical protein
MECDGAGVIRKVRRAPIGVLLCCCQPADSTPCQVRNACELGAPGASFVRMLRDDILRSIYR